MDGVPTLAWGRTLLAAGLALFLTYVAASVITAGVVAVTLASLDGNSEHDEGWGAVILAILLALVAFTLAFLIAGAFIVQAVTRWVAQRRMSFLGGLGAILASAVGAIAAWVGTLGLGEDSSVAMSVPVGLAGLTLTVFLGAWVIRRCARPLRDARPA
jgi:hypothetical protein